MTRSIEDANDLSALDAKVLREIHTDGWQITGVLAREQERGPDFAYSIGFFHSLGHPEVILFGLPLLFSLQEIRLPTSLVNAPSSHFIISGGLVLIFPVS